MPDERKIVLVGYGTDPLVEAFWTRRHRLYEFLAKKQFDLVLAPNYSMYGSQPRAEHLLNFRRNLLVSAEMNAAGIPTSQTSIGSARKTSNRYVLLGCRRGTRTWSRSTSRPSAPKGAGR